MAIAFDAVSTGTTTGTALTIAHTCTGADRILFVSVHTNTTTDVITGVTYGGVAMTRVAEQQATSGGAGNLKWTYLYMLVAPASGANNIVISASSSIPMWGYSTSYTGAAQTGQPDSTNSANAASGTGFTITTTTVADNSWVVAGIRNYAANVVGSTNYTVRSAAFPIAIGDSNGPKTPAGSIGQTATSSDGQWNGVQASFAPAVAASTNSNFFQFM